MFGTLVVHLLMNAVTFEQLQVQYNVTCDSLCCFCIEKSCIISKITNPRSAPTFRNPLRSVLVVLNTWSQSCAKHRYAIKSTCNQRQLVRLKWFNEVYVPFFNPIFFFSTRVQLGSCLHSF